MLPRQASLLSWSRRSRRPIYVIPNPVERPPILDNETCRRELGLPLDRPIAGVIAHLHPTKGHHLAVTAWEELDQPRPLLVLAGGDLYGQASVDYRRSLEAQIAEKGLRRRCHAPWARRRHGEALWRA